MVRYREFIKAQEKKLGRSRSKKSSNETPRSWAAVREGILKSSHKKTSKGLEGPAKMRLDA